MLGCRIRGSQRRGRSRRCGEGELPPSRLFIGKIEPDCEVRRRYHSHDLGVVRARHRTHLGTGGSGILAIASDNHWLQAAFLGLKSFRLNAVGGGREVAGVRRNAVAKDKDDSGGG